MRNVRFLALSVCLLALVMKESAANATVMVGRDQDVKELVSNVVNFVSLVKGDRYVTKDAEANAIASSINIATVMVAPKMVATPWMVASNQDVEEVVGDMVALVNMVKGAAAGDREVAKNAVWVVGNVLVDFFCSFCS